MSTAAPGESGPSSSHLPTLPHGDQHIALIGLGAIGISFLALHLTYTSARISVFDPRPDLQKHVADILPLYLPSPENGSEAQTGTTSISAFVSSGRLRFCDSVPDAVGAATIVQEQGPENLAFKQGTWSEVLRHVSKECHLWSSTSGIPASQQLAHLTSDATPSSAEDSGATLPEDIITSARERLLIVHPFNPPHLMPLLELVPSPATHPARLTFARDFFTSASPLHRPIPIAKETPGFVANRLSFILFREACSLVSQGVCTAQELDEIVRASLGPRWAVGGPFEMYNFGGGARGFGGFLDNIGGAIAGVWEDSDRERGGIGMSGEGAADWQRVVTEQVAGAYGVPSADDVRRRDKGLREVVRVQEELRREEK